MKRPFKWLVLRWITLAAAVILVPAAVTLGEPLRLYFLAAALLLFVPPILSTAWPAYKRTIIIAAVLFVVSVFEFGGVLVDLYLLAVVVFLLVPGLLWSAFTNRQRAGIKLNRIGIYVFALIAIGVQDSLQGEMAQRHAVEIGKACLAYRSKYQHYPKNVNELVPEFLSSIPIANLGMRRQFFYAPPLTKDGEPCCTTCEFPHSGERFTMWKTVRGVILPNT